MALGLYLTFELGVTSGLRSLLSISPGIQVTVWEQHVITLAGVVSLLGCFVFLPMVGGTLYYLNAFYIQENPLTVTWSTLSAYVCVLAMPVAFCSLWVLAYIWFVICIVGNTTLTDCNKLVALRKASERDPTALVRTSSIKCARRVQNGEHGSALEKKSRTMKSRGMGSDDDDSDSSECAARPESELIEPPTALEDELMCHLVELNERILPAITGGANGVILVVVFVGGVSFGVVVGYGYGFTDIWSRTGLSTRQVDMVCWLAMICATVYSFAMLSIPAFLNTRCDELVNAINGLRWVHAPYCAYVEGNTRKCLLARNEALVRVQALTSYAHGANGGAGLGVTFLGRRLSFGQLILAGSALGSFFASRLATYIVETIYNQTNSSA